MGEDFSLGSPTLNLEAIMRRLNWQLAFVVTIVFAAGCAPRIAEFDIRLGELKSRDSGYYAYTTSLPQKPTGHVCFTAATKHELAGRRLFDTGTKHEVYPRIAYAQERFYCHPDEVMQLLPDCNPETPVGGDTLTLGYFVKRLLVDRHYALAGKAEDDIPKGLKWTSLSTAARARIAETLPILRERIGREVSR